MSFLDNHVPPLMDAIFASNVGQRFAGLKLGYY